MPEVRAGCWAAAARKGLGCTDMDSSNAPGQGMAKVGVTQENHLRKGQMPEGERRGQLKRRKESPQSVKEWEEMPQTLEQVLASRRPW